MEPSPQSQPSNLHQEANSIFMMNQESSAMLLPRHTRRPASSKNSTATTVEEQTDNEKTIPFLRRLTDMLQDDNDSMISFHPGVNGSLAQIVVHDRSLVETHILPKYFNHSSFASLRRQLNYFAFSRVGRGRRNSTVATYQNASVVEMSDILKLKRRTCAGASVTSSDSDFSAVARNSSTNGDNKRQSSYNRKVSPKPSKLKKTKKIENGVDGFETTHTRAYLQELTPSVSISSFGEIHSSSPTSFTNSYESSDGSSAPPNTSPRIVLDLTQPENSVSNVTKKFSSVVPKMCTMNESVKKLSSFAKEDLMLCSVLLNLGGGR